MGLKIFDPKSTLGTLKSMGFGLLTPGLMDSLQHIVGGKHEDKEKEEGNAGKVPQVASQGNQVTYKKGGLVTRADGAAKRGKTKGRTV
jgi:hypothetical protein